MFSSITMASSTTSPMASTRASSVSVLMEKPNKAISANEPIRLTGMVIKGMTEARSVRRNTKMTSATSTAASAMVVYTALMERSMKMELSLATSMLTPGGNSSVMRGNMTCTAAESSSGFAVAWRITPSEIASRPL